MLLHHPVKLLVAKKPFGLTNHCTKNVWMYQRFYSISIGFCNWLYGYQLGLLIPVTWWILWTQIGITWFLVRKKNYLKMETTIDVIMCSTKYHYNGACPPSLYRTHIYGMEEEAVTLTWSLYIPPLFNTEHQCRWFDVILWHLQHKLDFHLHRGCLCPTAFVSNLKLGD